MNELKLLYKEARQKQLLFELLPEESIIDEIETNSDESNNAIVINVDELQLEQKANVLNAYIEEITPATNIKYTTSDLDLSQPEMIEFVNHRLESVIEEENEDGDVFVIQPNKNGERYYTILYYPYLDAETDEYTYLRPPVRTLLDRKIIKRVESKIMYYDTDKEDFFEVTNLSASINPDELLLSEIYYVK